MRNGVVHRRPGFFMTDAIVGFIVIGVLGWVLVVAITKSSGAQRRLNDSAAALTTAEQVLAIMRQGQAPPQNLGEAKVEVRAAEGGKAVAGQRWVEVVVSLNGRTGTLVGLVPEGTKP
jgi:type II secretory pathway pseudopilin PulG